MEQPVTYQELLAEQYEESARDLLAFQQIDYDKELEDVGTYQRNNINTYTVERPDEFNTFGGDRNTEDIVSKTTNFDDKSRFSVRYNKDVKINTFNIDSRFRAYVSPATIVGNNPSLNQIFRFKRDVFSPTAVSSASHFVFRIRRQIKNAISIKLSSLELPNTFANFSNARGNTSFRIRNHDHPDPLLRDYSIVNIDSNNVPEYIPNAQILAEKVQEALRALDPDIFEEPLKFYCAVNSQGYITIGRFDEVYREYDFDFAYTPIEIPIFDPLGVSMGFKTSQTLYQGVSIGQLSNLTPAQSEVTCDKVTATYFPDLNTDDYIYININDYNTVIPQTINDTYFTVFAKIPVTVDKGQIIFDNDSNNSTNKTYRFLLPSNLQQLEIQLLDRGGQELTFDGNYSMTLEVEEILNQSLYEKMREL
jgi:hypothetical protein